MSLPVAVLRVLVSMMEEGNALNVPVTYAGDDLYEGVVMCPGLSRLQDMEMLEIESTEFVGLGPVARVRLLNRSDFLSGFAAGALAFRNGQDLYYAEYNSHPLAFTAGWQHAHQRQKKRARAYDSARGYVCHGFECSSTGQIHKQI